MRRTRSLSLMFAAAPLGAVLAMSAAAHAGSVGTAGAVNKSSSGTPPGAPTRVIEIGTQVVENEKIQTTGTGSVQVLFIDKTTLNVGPNSSLVIDRFVYNPATTDGQLALSLTKGVLRVVGGVATHSEGATIRTPAAAIGLRGGIAIISHDAAKGTHAILGFGHMSVTTLCGAGNCTPSTVQVTRPGFGVTVAGFNRPPSSPGRASSQQLAQASAQLTSHGGQTGGASQQPTDKLAESYNVGTPKSPGARVGPTQGANATGANAVQAFNTTGSIYRAGAQISASVNTAVGVAVRDSTPTTPVTPPVKPIVPPIKPIVPPAAPLTYAMVTNGTFSTGSGHVQSPVPYLTGAFAGKGGFTVSPILGYQAGGLNLDGTPNTTSRQFQAGLRVTGKDVNQSATLFVMTSQISNAPKIGFTQAGGFTGVTVRNDEKWYGLAGGSVSSATPTSAPNTVSTVNGTPIAGFSLNNTNTNLNTGAVVNSPSSNYVRSSSVNYTFNPITAGTPTFTANNHPNLALSGYVGGVMRTALGGTPDAPTNFTKPYVITNLTGTPGDPVSIFLPGNSSEMLAVFNVQSVAAPSGAMTKSGYVFGSLDPSSRLGLNGARGAYINPSNFAGRAATIYADGANIPISTRDGVPLSEAGGFANQQMVTAGSVGANTSAFLTSISTAAAVQPCHCESTQWGFWSAFNGVTNSDGKLAFEDQGPLLLWVAGVPMTPSGLDALSNGFDGDRHGHLHWPRDRQYRQPEQHHQLSRRGHVLEHGQFRKPLRHREGRRHDQRTRRNELRRHCEHYPVHRIQSRPRSPLVGNVGGRTATLAGSFFQGGATSKLPAFGEMGGSLILNGAGGYLGSGIFAARNLTGIQPIK